MAIASFAPSQLAQRFWENDSGNSATVFLFGGALYLFQADEVGSMASGGGTSQWFVYKSLDNGTTWASITPASPQKFSTGVGQAVAISGHVVYMSAYSAQKWKFYAFDLNAAAWLADTAQTNVVNVGTNNGVSLAVKTNGQIVLCFGESAQVNGPANYAVYDPASDTWTVQPTAFAALTFSCMCGGVTDSVGHCHFFAVQWSGVAFGSGSATLQHFVIKPDNTTVGPDLAFTFANIPDKFLPWGDASVPVDYFDVVPAQQKISIAVGTRNNASPFTGNIVGLQIVSAVESDTPTWSSVLVPTGENFAQVTLANSQVTAMMVATLLPIQFTTQTQLHIFWTANGQAIAPGMNPWNNYLRHLALTNGTFAAITTEFTSLNTKIMPGSLYPILLSNNGSTAQVGGMFPTIDYSLFTSGATKYSALQNWWMSYAAMAPGGALTLDCNNPPSGNVGVAYSHALLAAGGTPPYTFAIVAGSLPSGLAVGSTTGVISGIPQQLGSFVFTVQVTDSLSATASVQCTININQGDGPKGGGGVGVTCRTVMCHPRTRSKCLGWGPLWITQDRGGYRLVYQSRTGLQTFSLAESGPLLVQIARCIARAECVPQRLNNPGALPLMKFGQIDPSGQLARFPDWQTGVRYLYDAIRGALDQSKSRGRVL